MAEAEYLIGLAQIALGLAGFTGVVIAFGNQPSKWTRADSTRFFLLLTTSIGAIFNTLLPLAINALGVNPPLLWRCASLIVALCFIVTAFFYYRRLAHLSKEEAKSVSRPLAVFLSVGSFITIVVQLLNVFGVFGAPFGIFLTGLLWGLFVPAVQFGRMVYVHFGRDPDDDKEQPVVKDQPRALEGKGIPVVEINRNEAHAASAEAVGSGVKRESSPKK